MQIIPARNKVICKNLSQETTLEGFVIPEQDEKTKPEIAEVLSVGKGELPVPIKPGDKIIYAKYMETKVNVGEGLKLVCVDFKDIYGKIDDGKRTA